MIILSLNENNRGVHLFDTEVWLDDNVENYIELNESEFKQIWESGNNGDWLVENGLLVHSPVPIEEVSASAGTLPSGEIPASVL